MSIDAVALLRIAKLAAPTTPAGGQHVIRHRGNASLLHTFDRFDPEHADEHALALRKLLGPALDAHDDPRGVLFFPDVAEPRAKSYEKLVKELGGAGVWAPLVALDHVPLRYANAAEHTHDKLVARIAQVMGQDAALQLDMLAQVQLLVLESTGGRADAAAEYQAQIAILKSAVGAELTKLYEASLRKNLAQVLAAAGGKPRFT
jgi:hypothetical protein